MSTTREGLRFGQLRVAEDGDPLRVVYTPSGQARYVHLSPAELGKLLQEAGTAANRMLARAEL